MALGGRIRKELADIVQDKKSNITVTVLGDDSSKLAGVIHGPEGTPYEGGTFRVSIEIPQLYPFEPPKMKFLTKIWHPNISSQTGAICLDILKDQWSPALTIKTALLSLQALMCTPEPSDPQDAQVANQYLSDYQGWVNTAKFWTESYATEGGSGSAPPPDGLTTGGGGGGSGAGGGRSLPSTGDPRLDAAIGRLVDMGFDAERARTKLVEHNLDEPAAVNALLS